MKINMYVSKPRMICAIQYNGELSVPSYLSVRGIKLEPKEREVEFYNKLHDKYLSARYGEYINTTDLNDMYPITKELFEKSYEYYEERE